MNTNEFYEFSNIPPQLSFTSSEHNIGKSILKSMNIKENDKFICFHARDKSYMEKLFPNQDNQKHIYRNSKIKNCIPAVEFITKANIWALRMGAIVENPIISKNPKIIDYATNHRSDFGDIFLIKHCKFFLSSTYPGIAATASMLGTPIVSPNIIPIGVIPLNKKDLFIVPELNYMGQFSSVLRGEGINAVSITQYTGLPFKVRDLVKNVTELVDSSIKDGASA